MLSQQPVKYLTRIHEIDLSYLTPPLRLDLSLCLSTNRQDEELQEMDGKLAGVTPVRGAVQKIIKFSVFLGYYGLIL